MAKVFADDISLSNAAQPLLSYRRFAIDDSSGNRNGKLDRGEVADCVLTLRRGARAVSGLAGTLRSLSPNLEVLSPGARFSAMGTGDTLANTATPFRLHAFQNAAIDVPQWCELALAGDSGFCDTLRVPILVGDSMNEPLGPDAYGYFAYDDADLTYAEHPVYDWVEIRDVGTQLPLGDDETRTIDLPPEFGPIRYYGASSTKLSICSNGWVAPDTNTRVDFNNIILPDPVAPARIIALFWDNFDPTAFGWIGYYHDAPNHRFIVEYDSVPYYPLHDNWEKFEIVFYDSTLAGLTGDNTFVVQYASANDPDWATVGCQNADGTSGLNYLWNSLYRRQSAPLTPGRAIKYVAGPPTAIAEKAREASFPSLAPLALSCSPNSVSRMARISFSAGRSGRIRIGIFDATGRQVASLVDGSASAGRHSAVWDAGRFEQGVYFCRVQGEAGQAALKLVVSR